MIQGKIREKLKDFVNSFVFIEIEHKYMVLIDIRPRKSIELIEIPHVKKF